jgi:hypothetical protein
VLTSTNALDLFQVYPVVDVNDRAQAAQQGVEFRDSIG